MCCHQCKFSFPFPSKFIVVRISSLIMNEIERSNSSSDVSSNSSWTFLEDLGKNDINIEKKNSEVAFTSEQSEDNCEIKSDEPCVLYASTELENIPSETKNYKNIGDVEKILDVNIKKTAENATFDIYNPLKYKNCIGTLTVVGTVLALTGLSFLCLLVPSNNTSCPAAPNGLTNFSNVSPNYIFPIYENENTKKSLIIDDSNGILANKLKSMTPSQSQNERKSSSPEDNGRFSEDTLVENGKQTFIKFEDSMKSKESNKFPEKNNIIECAAARHIPQEGKTTKHGNNLFDKGNTVKNKNTLNIKNYTVFSVKENLQEHLPKKMEEISTKLQYTQKIHPPLSNKSSKSKTHKQYPNDSKPTASKQDEILADIKIIKNKIVQQKSNTFNEERIIPKTEKNVLNVKQKEQKMQRCYTERMHKRSLHSTRCCRRRSFCRQRSMDRKPFSKSQIIKTLRHHISRATALYSQFVAQFPNLKILLLLCQDILLLKLLSRICKQRSCTAIKSSEMNLRTKQNIQEVETVESIAEFSLKRLFDDTSSLQYNSTKTRLPLTHTKTNNLLSDHCPSLQELVCNIDNSEQEFIIFQENDATEHSSKHTCKCYRNHAKAEIPSKKVRKLLENYEKMITSCDLKKNIDDAKNSGYAEENNSVVACNDSCEEQEEEEKNTAVCFKDAYECECKFENSKLLCEIPKSKYGVTFQTTSKCTVIKGKCKTKNSVGTTKVNNVLDQIVTEALHSIRESYQQHIPEVSDSNDEQNHADDEHSSDSESESKRISAHSNAICKKTKTDNMNYLLLFGKSKSQLKKRDLNGQSTMDQQILSRKKMMNKKEPEKSHLNKNFQHYKMLQ